MQNAGYKQFFLSPQCFERLILLGNENEIMGVWDKPGLFCQEILTHSHTMTPVDAPGKTAF